MAVESGKYISKTETISSEAAPGHILVKVAYSTCNPYDYLVYNGSLEDGTRLGSEGCGTVISVGEGVDNSLQNKKVAFTSSGGNWAQYKSLDAKISHFMVLEDSQDLK